MTDKEFKRLSRAQLIDIIYQLQLKQEELTKENQKLKEELADRRIRLRQTGNLAQAVLELNNVMQAAQAAADQYLEEIRIMQDETKEKCQLLLDNARKEAEAIVEKAKKAHPSRDAALEAIMKEFGPNDHTTGERK